MPVLRGIAFLGAQSLERLDDFFFTDLQRIGDHTRGLFEAEASIVESATQFAKDGFLFGAHGHDAFLRINDENGAIRFIRLRRKPWGAYSAVVANGYEGWMSPWMNATVGSSDLRRP